MEGSVLEPHQQEINQILPRSKALALFQFLQQGIPIIFNGEEIGMNNDSTPSKYAEGMAKEGTSNSFSLSMGIQATSSIIRALLPEQEEDGQLVIHLLKLQD